MRRAGVPFVLVSGRTRPRLGEVARLLGAAGWLAELGSLDAGYPTRPGESVHEAIARTGVVEALLEHEAGRLVPHLPWSLGREGSHVFRGRASAGAADFVARRSGGTLRLADNGGREDGLRVYHLTPTGAGKAEAVARDAARRGADAARCLAVGNGREDLAMGHAVGHVALVANAVAHDPSLAADAPWVTRAPYGAGVLEAVERWLGGEAP
jgi:hydroxymethylpyrimidine pyrophosphatase-like HAD family hydrolase